MDAAHQKAVLSRSVADGIFGTIWTSLAGGAFLVGYALKIFHADSRVIGALAALPLMANVVQVAGAILIERTGRIKPISIAGVTAGRLAWLGVILLPLVLAHGAPPASWPLIAAIGVSSLFAAVGSVGWTAWMGDLVPAKRRGAFFGRRNMIASVAGMAAMLLGGRFLDSAARWGIPVRIAFAGLFAVGLLCGMVSVWFLSRLPETGTARAAPARHAEGSLILRPLRDANFRTLILSVCAWSVAIQMAGPFYSVFLIDALRADFGTITLFGTCATVATLLMMRTWGPISDRHGNRPVIVVSSWVLAVVPVLWVIARPGAYFLPVLLANLVSGAAMAGAALSQFNILIKLSPREGRSMYIAVFSALTGLVGAAAPLAGGLAVRALHGLSLTVLSFHLSSLHLLFLASSLIQAVSILPALRIREPAATAPSAVLLQLKNDLNPQTGIASSADFVLLEVRRGRRVLREVDRRTERLARMSERRISVIADRLGSATAGIRARLRRYLQDTYDDAG